MSKVEVMVSALRRENNRYLAAIANVSAAVAELSDTVEALQRQLGVCNMAASQALRMAGEGGSLAEELGWTVWMLAGVGLLLLIKSPVMSLLLFAWGCLDNTRWRGVASVVLMFPVDPVGALAFAGMQIWEAITAAEEDRVRSQRASSGSSSRIPCPISTCRVNINNPVSGGDGDGDDVDESSFHDVPAELSADSTSSIDVVLDRPNVHVARVRPWYVRAVLGAMDGVVHGDGQ